MDPFSDKGYEEELDDEKDDDNVHEKSFSSRHSNGIDDNNFNRVSLQSAIDDFKRVNSNALEVKEIHFDINDISKRNNDIEHNHIEEEVK